MGIIYKKKYHKYMVLFIISLFLAGCALPDPFTKENCNYYGVLQGNQIGSIREEIELPINELQQQCNQGHIGTKNMYVGCVKENDDGTVTIYYRIGDRRARNHEISHAVCGPGHTGKYYRTLIPEVYKTP